MDEIKRTSVLSPAVASELQRSFVIRVYGWMTFGLLVTAAASVWVLTDLNMLRALLENSLLFWGLVVAELVLVLILSAQIKGLNVTTARVAFVGYAALTGVSMSPLALVYTASSIAQVFVITAGVFGITCAYGYFTKRDLSGLGSYLFMGLLGLILATGVSWLFGSSVMEYIVSLVSVVIFIAITAFDVQALRIQAATPGENGEVVQKAAIIGALNLYLDFVNLFLRLLQLFGSSDD